MENKPFFMDEKEMQALKNAQSEDVVEEEKEVEPETVIEEVVTDNTVEEKVTEETITGEKQEEPTDKQKYELEKIKDDKKENLGIKKNLKLYVTIICCVIVAYVLFVVGRGLYYGFKYYDIAHNGTTTTEPQK